MGRSSPRGPTDLLDVPMIRDPLPPAELELLLIEADSQPSIRARLVNSGTLVAGRAPTSDLLLPHDDRDASRMHFVIKLSPTNCHLTNNSKHGTFVNGMEVKTECDLRHGDLLRAGRSTFHVEIRRDGAPAELIPATTGIWQPVSETTTSPGREQVPVAPAPISLVQVANYRLLRPLGIGGMGTVWLAEDAAGRHVACKLIRPELALDRDTCARFRREANHLRDLSHRYVVGFREAGEFHGLLYLVMDYVPGKSLADLLRDQGAFTVGRAVRLTCQVLEALGAAHGNGVVHRDVKPSNVMVQEGPDGEEVRLADFGLAKPYQTGEVGISLTLPGSRGGTLAFAAPEMLIDFRLAGPLADQYGAAAMLYNLLADRHHHDARNAIELLVCIRDRDAVPLCQRRSGLPEGLVNVIHRALDREPRLRFPTIHALRAELLPYAG